LLGVVFGGCNEESFGALGLDSVVGEPLPGDMNVGSSGMSVCVLG
jgi:hypothetical protein